MLSNAKIARISVVFLGLATAACHDDDPVFLPLADLCDVYAQEVCDGRQACCEGFDRDVCESMVRTACRAQSDQLTVEADLSYDGERANRVRGELRDALARCQVLPLGAFFDGTLGVAEPCGRSGQCESVTCSAPAPGSEMVCSDPAAQPLCDPADI
ncbi:MAG: hypothetical protein QM778_35880 [Myxococcales bacterium]